MFEIRMNHPARNAIGPQLLTWLNDQLDAADGRPLLLMGTEDSFSAGLDLKQLLEFSAEELPAFLTAIDDLAVRLFTYPAPTVACVNGHAIAGGCVLTVCCDYRVAEARDDLRIGMPEIKLGACFPPRMMAVLRHRLNPQHLYEIMLGGELYSPAAAQQLGLIDLACAQAEETAVARCKQMAAYPADTFRRTKQSLQHGVTEVSEAQQRAFEEEELPIWGSSAMRQRVQALFAR
jgi:enoyl-CoA hydratase